jgi:cyclopropane-fatty-acyl-phospholipid synthase
MSTRGEHLVRADRRFATGGGRIARFIAPAISRMLDEIERGLERGGIDLTLPDGSRRGLGFHAPGAAAVV